MPQHTLRFRNETNEAQSRLQIVFRITRSKFLTLHVFRAADDARPVSNGTVPDSLQHKGYLPGKGRLWLLLGSPVPDGESAMVGLDYSEEPPVVEEDECIFGIPTKEQIVDANFAPLERLDFDTIFDGFDFLKALRFWDRFLVDEPNPKFRRYKAFFRSLDLETNPDLMFATDVAEKEKQQKAEMLNKALQILFGHLRTRIEGIAGGQSRPLSDYPREARPALVQSISNLMLPVYKEFYSKSKSGDPLDQEQIAEAFCRFANGELRTGKARLDSEGVWNCEPDSYQEVLFAVHCIWSILNGVDADYWTTILPCTAASHEFFLRAYHPDGSPPYLLRRWGPWNFKKTRPLTDADITEVFDRYRRLTVEEISKQIDENIRSALHGGFRPGS
jgi:hypothetical protein